MGTWMRENEQGRKGEIKGGTEGECEEFERMKNRGNNRREEVRKGEKTQGKDVQSGRKGGRK